MGEEISKQEFLFKLADKLVAYHEEKKSKNEEWSSIKINKANSSSSKIRTKKIGARERTVTV